MRRLVDLVVLDRLDGLIRRQSTGTPHELAERLEISRSSLFELILYLREELQAPIQYNKYMQSYIYTYPPRFYLGFEQDRLSDSETYQTMAGSVKSDDNFKNWDMDNSAYTDALYDY